MQNSNLPRELSLELKSSILKISSPFDSQTCSVLQSTGFGIENQHDRYCPLILHEEVETYVQVQEDHADDHERRGRPDASCVRSARGVI